MINGNHNSIQLKNEYEYLNLLFDITFKGIKRSDRTGVGTLSLFGKSMTFDLERGFPLLTTKKMNFKAIVVELLWFLSGSSNIKYLHEHGVHIWDEWADKNGDLGPIYGVQWRNWDGIDQIKNVLHSLKTDPYSRRHVVSAWNVADLNEMRLMPCHVMFQFHVAAGKLHCTVYQRSCDMFLGVPFNIASYALLTHLVAEEVGLKASTLSWMGGDCHIYKNHLDQVKSQLRRTPYDPPTLKFNKEINDIFSVTPDDIEINGYRHHGAIKAPIAV